MTAPAAAAAIAAEAFAVHHASQRSDELVEAVALVAELEPSIVVEIGCDAGGTLYCWTQLGAETFGITLPVASWATGGQGYPLNTHGARVYLGNSHRPQALAWLVEQLAERPVDVLFIDGDHSYEGVDADYQTYAPLVRPGGLILIHDVCNGLDKRVEVDRWWVDHFPAGRVIASKRSRPVGFGVITKEG